MPAFEDKPIIDAFKALDNAGTGKLNAAELKQLITSLGDPYPDELADKLIADMGGGSEVDYEKFVTKMNAEANKDPYEGLE